jgi:uncharacterized membrane protein HdeD (DUF308 family)
MLIIWAGNWWALALRAAAAILLGLIAFALPGPTLAAIVVLFGVYAIIDGALALVAAVRGLRRHERWGAMLAEGIVSLAAGVIALVAAWALLTGVLEITLGVRLRRVITGEWLLILGGVLSVALAVLVAMFPGAGATALVWWLGAYALAYGAVALVLAFRIRHWTRLHPGG